MLPLTPLTLCTYPANAWNVVVVVPIAVAVVVVVVVLNCPMIVVVVVVVDEAVAGSKRRPFRFGNGTKTTTNMLMNVP